MATAVVTSGVRAGVVVEPAVGVGDGDGAIVGVAEGASVIAAS